MIGRPDSVTTSEINVLEQAFIDSYDNVECGDRDIDSMRIVTNETEDMNGQQQRMLQASTNNRNFTYIFQAQSRCRGCGQNARLYAADSTVTEGGDCPCEAPTGQDFLLSFNSTISRLVSDGLLENVIGVNGNFAELEEQVECEAESTFDTLVYISFQ